jgi:hypothetical protein
MIDSMKRGLTVGLKTTWNLGKFIFPITLIMTILQFTPILPWIAKTITPLMKVFGLTGDAAIPLVLGYFLNLYAAIGAILTLHLTIKEVFILAIMTCFCHNLPVESMVAAKAGVKIWIVLTVRIALSFLAGIFVNLLWHGGTEMAHMMIQAGADQPEGFFAILLLAVEKAALGIYQLAIIVIPLMVVIQILKDLQWIHTFSKYMSPFIRALGMRENTSTTMAAGLFFGLAYGAGVMIQAVEEDGVSQKDLTLAMIFLAACHAIVEDTLLFAPLGVPIWGLFAIRFSVAIILTLMIGNIWKRSGVMKRKEPSYEHKI